MKASARPAVTVSTVKERKAPPGTPLVMVTAYDTPTAQIAEEAGVDIILVGDSLGMVVLGYPDTLSVDLQDMVRHTAAVGRAEGKALVVADLPWLSYHMGPVPTLRAAARLIRAGARAVKMEGVRTDTVEFLVEAGVPVMGHLGLTPQSVRTMGGYKVQGRTPQQADALLEQASELVDAGCFSIVLEGVPALVAEVLRRQCPVPIIGIGAGAHCDGQVLVFHDLLGLGESNGAGPARPPRFVRQYQDLRQKAVEGLSNFADDVRNCNFPSAEESYPDNEQLREWTPACPQRLAGRQREKS